MFKFLLLLLIVICFLLDHEANPKREEQKTRRRDEGIPRESGKERVPGNSYVIYFMDNG